MVQIVRIKPELSEGFFGGPGVGNPMAFTAEVGTKGIIDDWPIEGWDGIVTEGQSAYIGKRVILTPRMAGYTGAVAAFILYEDENGEKREVYSGICKAKGLK